MAEVEITTCATEESAKTIGRLWLGEHPDHDYVSVRYPDVTGTQRAVVAVTDEMVDRATLALTNELRRKHGLGPMASLDELVPEERTGFTADMRVALEAALTA